MTKHELPIFVPLIDTETRHMLASGSGVVGSVGLHCPSDQVRIDFEGNIYKTEQFARWGTRVSHAAGRHTWNAMRGYPTVARLIVPRKDLLHVGFFTADEREDGTWVDGGKIDLTDDKDALTVLTHWIGTSDLDAERVVG